MEVLGGISDQMADIGDELYAASDREKLREWGNEIDAPGQGALIPPGTRGRSMSESGGKTVGMVSLGCPKNLVDGEVMLGWLAGAGYEIVPDAEQADVIVVNTCAFIDRAKQESIDAILEMAALEGSGRARRLVVTGCLVGALRRGAPKRDPRDRRDRSAPARSARHRCARWTAQATHPRSTARPGRCPTWVYDHTPPRVLSTPP